MYGYVSKWGDPKIVFGITLSDLVNRIYEYFLVKGIDL